MTVASSTPAPTDSHHSHHAAARTRERAQRARRTEELLDLLDDLDEDSDAEARSAALAELVEVNLGVAHSIAARYRNRGITLEDLEQVASLALVRVARTYDHHAGHDFLSYAVPSIRGEIRRHFRDQGWMVRPPRRVQELQGQISSLEPELGVRLGHPPAASELASELGASKVEVEEALAASGCFTPASLDLAVGESETSSLGDRLGHEEEAFAAVEARVLLAPVLSGLSGRERRILRLRFARGWTQQEIADEIGVTQMQVSRLLSTLLRRLRTSLDGEEAVSA